MYCAGSGCGRVILKSHLLTARGDIRMQTNQSLDPSPTSLGNGCCWVTLLARASWSSSRNIAQMIDSKQGVCCRVERF